MVNTPRIKNEIEPAVRDWLNREFSDTVFEERQVKYPSGGSCVFEAVSQDGRIVASILCNRAKTGTKKENTGGLKKAFTALERLKMLGRDTVKMMVFTDLDFSNLVLRRASHFGIETIKLLVCPLPPDKKLLLDQIMDAAAQD